MTKDWAEQKKLFSHLLEEFVNFDVLNGDHFVAFV